MSQIQDVPNLQDRSRFLLTIAAITVSVLLFACGGNREQTESADIPVRPRVSEATVTMAAPAIQHVQPVASAPLPQAPPPPAETAPQPEPSAPGLEMGATRVFSNKDLRRYTKVKEEFGLGDDAITVDLTPKTPETGTPAAAVMTDAQRDEEMRETMKKINELNAEAAYLKSRIPSLHNPFLARVKLSEADAMAEAGMGNAERLERVNDRLSQVDLQLDQLRRRLADLNQPKPGQETP